MKFKTKIFTWSPSKNRTIITNGLFKNSIKMTISDINLKRAKRIKKNKINYKFVY